MALSLIPLTTRQSQTQIMTRAKGKESHMTGLLSNATPVKCFMHLHQVFFWHMAALIVVKTYLICHGLMKSISESLFRQHEQKESLKLRERVNTGSTLQV